ncbi:hypothetical protein TWF106_004629 [Orbilia oligospora]|uniref:Uncharacterized protein n=1 Tax=Orbilia oligospora TaxID=2813651 RepID=A0A6G1M618_ORBOL|nr:hypothetical protein TWF788_003105 [Orbilia oligospora]KAF3204581.1 hypothetical protein TWF679_009783 [Orbilia oligospora]KAF3223982.1 hypothetical protein TWF106_004629 [Orbilia oligospora]KAF3246629.1 hypothetical protein TWF192_006786 [Orbilia oligospora]
MEKFSKQQANDEQVQASSSIHTDRASISGTGATLYLSEGRGDGVATEARTESAGSDRRGDLEEALEDPSIAGSSLGSSSD